MIEDASRFRSVLKSFEGERGELTKKNATRVVSAIIESYEAAYGVGDVGKEGTGRVNEGSGIHRGPVGLIYGRIQSGKTTAMLTSAALAFDNRFRIVVVLTSDINRLVEQTSRDFVAGIPELIIFTKDDLKSSSLPRHITSVGQSLREIDSYNLVVVCSKGKQALGQVLEFLRGIEANRYPSIILDDEGDQGTLDTKVRARSQGDGDVEPSTIFTLVHSDEANSLRSVLSHSVFVSVTGTPQSIVLQNMDSESRPSFVRLISPGEGYCGGDVFFGLDDPADNEYTAVIDDDEYDRLIAGDGNIPPGLRRAIDRFIVSATAAGIDIGWRQYKMLVHPSVSNSDHEMVGDLINDHLNNMLGALAHQDLPDSSVYIAALRREHDALGARHRVPPFDQILEVARERMGSRRLHVVNSSTTGRTLTYSLGYNVVIGGNSIGRGLAFKDLLVTYYLRSPKMTNMDTMYQHARMFGYRKEVLPYVSIFLTPERYDAFVRIARSDDDLREFLESRGGDIEAALIGTRSGIRVTRPAVLDAVKVETILPRTQIYPNRPVHEPPQSVQVLGRVRDRLAMLFPDFETKGREGIDISPEEAKELVGLIPTLATNSWKDKVIPDVLAQVAAGTGGVVHLRFDQRETSRVRRNGFMSTGVLGGVVDKSADDTRPVLLISQVRATGDDREPNEFIFPTIVWPRTMGPWVFNRS